MKEWSKSWVRSGNPRKQRNYVRNAPLHIIRKLMSVRLSKDLKTKFNKRNFPVRKGDKVKVMVGQFKGKIANVNKLVLKNKCVHLDDIFTVKRDGNKVPVTFNPSNLMITELNL